jgi:hypothetical protein
MGEQMNRTLSIIAVLSFATPALAASPMAMSAKPTHSAADKSAIISAMSAGPAAVGRDATIVVPDASSKMRVLRAGTNGFTCMPDDPSSPGVDPMCADKAGMEWLDAYIAHKPPAKGKVGLIYMLAGGSDASNTDPYASKPANGHWIATGPHVMVVGADAAFYAAYPSGANPDTSVPYVMWAGTPYQHLMSPVK